MLKEEEGWSLDFDNNKVYFKYFLDKQDINVVYNSKIIGIIRYPVSPDKLNRAILEFNSVQDNQIIKQVVLGFIGISNDRFLFSLRLNPFNERDFWEK